MSEPKYKDISRYSLATGRILGVGRIGYEIEPEEGQQHVDGRRSLSGEYFDLASRTIKQKEPVGASLSAASIALGESVTLSPLPIPCTVNVAGADVVVDDGVLEITPQSVGDAYRLMVDEVKYLRESWFFEVVANEN